MFLVQKLLQAIKNLASIVNYSFSEVLIEVPWNSQ